MQFRTSRFVHTGIAAAAALFYLNTVNALAQSPTLRHSPSAPAKARSFEIKGGQFLLDGKPFQIISGEMHYARIPPELWRQRLRMAKACGLNTIATYVFWNMQEPQKGKFDFTGASDIAKYIRIAQEEGLFVILRPGPYVCAEWDFGGFPYWLLNEQGMAIRTRDPKFMEYTQRYLTMLGKQLIPLQVSNGGNILMVQVENEYGSYGSDKAYIGMVRDAVHKAGFTAPLFMCDGGGQLANDYVAGIFPGENGGSGPDVKRTIDRYYSGGPYFVPEYYPGWLDHWGETMSRVGTAGVVRATERMLQAGMSFNYYMFHGGTNFGFTNGANFGAGFEPDITSYDYDAPLDEAGRATPKYMAIRAAIQKYLGDTEKIPDVPAPNPIVTTPTFELTETGSLLANLPKPILSEQVRSMEDIGQDYGFVLYRTTLHGPIDAKLVIKELRDYAVVMLDGKRVALVDRRRKSAAPNIVVPSGDAVLDILVENCGRINFGGLLLDNHKGITESVRLGETPLTGWKIYSLPLKSTSHLVFDGRDTDAPMLRRGHFTLAEVGDTYLDMRGWFKGIAFVNGHNLGKFWEIGPQQTLYVPSPWLKKGENEVTVVDLAPNGQKTVACIGEAHLDELHKEESLVKKRPAPPIIPSPTQAQQIASGEFTTSDAAQDVHFPEQSSRYICFQAITSYDGDYASCAELYLLNDSGKPVSRASWKIYYADSEESAQEDGSADNMIDDDQATIWHSVWSDNHTSLPHIVVIDLGKETSFSGLRYLARKGDKPAKTRKFALYASDLPFTGKGN